MSWRPQAIISSLAVLIAACSVSAQNPPLVVQKSQASPLNQHQPTPSDIPVAISPVAYFRKLLAMSPKERDDYLTNRPAQTRERIMAKIREYEMLSPDERELRLRATELRWYVIPLLQMNPADRDARVAKIPDDMREIVKNRLDEWMILPPDVKQEILENERTKEYFARIQPRANPTVEQQLAMQRQQVSAQFSQFLELTPEEKAQTLSGLSASERAQMQKTLEAFGKLSTEQQRLCVQNYAKFVGMSDADRAEFLRNAERWSQMSPAERQTWRDLVSNVPDWPPAPLSIYPPGTAPPVWPPDPNIPRPGVATN